MISSHRLLIVWLLLAACIGHAQQGGGTLRGTVTDADFGSPVSGATVQLSGAGTTSTTDADGRYSFTAVPAGSYDLTVSREGYVRTRKDGVIVNAGAVRSVEIALTGEVVELDAFTIAPDALLEEGSGFNAVNLAQSLDSMAIAINPGLLKAAGSTGNVGDAVKRLAGTAVVDSRYVVIRGLSDRYTAVVLNGARIPSSDPDRRAVNIDIFPTGLVDNVINSKTFTPDMPGESTGGHLNIITKKSPKEPFVNWSMSLGYNTLATGNDRFLTYRGGGVGMLGTASERQLPDYLKSTTIEDLPILPNGYDSPADDAFDAPNQRVSELRLRAARDLSVRSMGVNIATAPENFGFSIIGGREIEFAPGPVGIVAGLTYAKRYEVEQGLRGAVQLFSGQPGLVERMEFTKGEQSLLAGVLLGAAIDFSDTDHLALTYFTNIAAEDEAVFQKGENQRVGTVDNGIPLDKENIVVFRENLTYTERRLQTWQLTGQHEFPDHGDIKLNWVAAYSMSSQDQPDVRNSLVAYDFANGAYTSPGDAAPPNLERVWRVLNDTNYNVGLDVEIPWGDDPAEKERTKLKVGGSMDYSTREYETQNFQYVDGTAGTFPPLTPRLSQVDPDDSKGQTLPDVLGDLDQRDRAESTFGGTTSYLDILFLSRARDIPPGERYTGVQSIPSTYAMATFEITDDLEFIAGARLEYTDLSVISGGVVGEGITNQSAANFLSLDPETGLPIPAEKLQRPSILRSDLLPAVSAKWKFREDVTVRAAISRTVARPTFKEIAPVFARDPETGDFFVGNVLLQMSDILNYDTRFEYAPQEGDQYALSFFAKQITNPIEYVNLGVFDTVRNDRAASLYGFEIEAAKKLENLTEELSGFSLGLNYSYIFSQVELRKSNEDIRRKAGLSTNRPLQGQPEYTFNATVSYDNEDLGVNAAILLNVTGSLLTQVGGDQGNALVPDVYQRPYTSLDASLTKELWDDWKINLRVSNLLNSRRERYYPNDLPASDLISGTTYSIGLSKEW
jgi:outer membrane receptor protein involved in Fe transport